MRRTVSAGRAAGAVGIAMLAVGISACGVVKREPNLIAGKAAFVQKCGACHKLNRAGTTGVTGPDLDASFQRMVADGMRRSTIEGVVRKQIDIPLRRAQYDPQTGKPGAKMPADLVKGKLADDVSAYVALAAARGGEDAGRLADIGAKKTNATTTEKNGLVDIPADDSGALAFQYASATGTPGDLKLKMDNEGTAPHNIAVEGNGVREVGKVVAPGGVSEVDFDAKPGEYTYYCSVPGHREGGMVGKLTIK